MSNHNRGRISLKNNFIVTCIVMSVVGVILVSILLHKSFITHLDASGIDRKIIKEIDSELATYSTGAALATIIVLISLWIYLFRRITSPLQKILNRTYLIRDGDLSTRIDPESNDEIGKLEESFNAVATTLEASFNKLQESNHYTENILRSVPSILIVISNRLSILSSNIEFNSIHDQYPALDTHTFRRHLESEIRTVMETGKTIRKEIEVVPKHADDTLIFSSTISKIGTAGQNTEDDRPSVLLTITDMTYRRKLKELVFQSKQDWEDTFDMIPDIITIHDRDFNIIQANKAATEHLNLPILSPGRINKCYKYYHGTKGAPEGCPSCKCYETGDPATFELFEKNLNKFIEIRSIPRLNKESKVIGLIHIVRDITKRKTIEHEHENLLKSVTRAKLEWEATFDTVSEMIILVDKELRIRRCNVSFSDYVGLAAEDIIHRNFFDCFTLADSHETEHNTMLIQNEKSLTREEVQSNDHHWFYLSHRPIKDKDSTYMYTVIIATDITDLKSTQNRLLQSEKELKIKVNDLEKFYEMAIGREVKMKKLKREINDLRLGLAQTEGDGHAVE